MSVYYEYLIILCSYITGAVYIDGTSGNDTIDNAIAPGQTFTYVWIANKLHKPDTNNFHDHCAAFTYHSHVRAAKDVDSGLFGLALICNKGTRLLILFLLKLYKAVSDGLENRKIKNYNWVTFILKCRLGMSKLWVGFVHSQKHRQIHEQCTEK